MGKREAAVLADASFCLHSCCLPPFSQRVKRRRERERVTQWRKLKEKSYGGLFR